MKLILVHDVPVAFQLHELEGVLVLRAEHLVLVVHLLWHHLHAHYMIGPELRILGGLGHLLALLVIHLLLHHWIHHHILGR